MALRSVVFVPVLVVAVIISGPASACHPGQECYEKVRTPDVYQTVERPVVVHPGYREVVRLPAVTAVRTERVEVSPARVLTHNVPAVYGTIMRREMVAPASVSYVATAPIVRRMFDEGHAVALHASTRALMIKTPQDLAAILTRAADRIESFAGRRPCPLFRPHAGWRSGSMYEGLIQIDYRLVGWSWGLWDWDWFRARAPGRLARRLARRTSAGDIVVMHDGHHVDSEPDRRYAVEATRELVPALAARGFGFGVLCDASAPWIVSAGQVWKELITSSAIEIRIPIQSVQQSRTRI